MPDPFLGNVKQFDDIRDSLDAMEASLGLLRFDSSGNLKVLNASGSSSSGPITSITTSVTPGIGSAHLGKAEDAPHISGDTGVFTLAVRNDSNATLTSANFDYSPFAVNAAGALAIQDGGNLISIDDGAGLISIDDGGGSITVDGGVSVTFGKSQPVFADGDAVIAGSSWGFMVGAFNRAGGIFDFFEVDKPADGVSITNNQLFLTSSALRAANASAQYDLLRAFGDNADAVTVTTVGSLIVSSREMMFNGTSWDRVRGDTTNGLFVNVKAIVPGVAAASLGKAEDAVHVSGDTGVQMLAVRNDTPSALATSNGDYIPLTTDSVGRLQTRNIEYGPDNLPTYYANFAGLFDLPAGLIVDPLAATIAGVNTPNASQNGELWVGGGIASDGVDGGFPVKIGALARTSHITAVGNADRVNQVANTVGFAGMINMFNNRNDTFTSQTSGTTIDASFNPPKFYAMSVAQTGTVTAWDVRLEGSLDNVTFTQILQHTNATGTGVTVWTAAGAVQPVLYFRARCAGLTLGLGTNVIVTILAMQ